MRELLFFALLGLSLTLQAQQPTPGKIGARVTEDCKLLIWSIEPPSHVGNIVECWLESTAINSQLQILLHVDPLDYDTLEFDVPDTAFKVRRYVNWHFESGNRQYWTRRIPLEKCAPTSPEISDEFPPPNEPKIQIFGETIWMFSDWPGMLFVFDQLGNMAFSTEFDAGENVLELAQLPPGLFYCNLLFFDPTGLRSETITIVLH